MQKLFENWKKYLTELVVDGPKQLNPEEKYYIIVSDGKAYVSTNESEMSVDGFKSVGFYNLMDEAEDQPNIFFGEMQDKKLWYFSRFTSLDPKSSILIKKIVKQFGIDSVSRNTSFEAEETQSKFEIRGEIPNIAYHGTISKYVPGIMKFGLKPGERESNYGEISHDNLVFLTTKFDEAWNHSVHTMFKHGSDPVLIEFSIPNKNLLVPDYDVDVASEDSYYEHVPKSTREKAQKYAKKMKGKSFSLSREFGIYGYKGRIPAKFIKSYYIVPNFEESGGDIDKISFKDPENSGGVWVTPEEMKTYIETKDEYGYGYFDRSETEDEEQEED